MSLLKRPSNAWVVWTVGTNEESRCSVRPDKPQLVMWTHQKVFQFQQHKYSSSCIVPSLGGALNFISGQKQKRSFKLHESNWAQSFKTNKVFLTKWPSFSLRRVEEERCPFKAHSLSEPSNLHNYFGSLRKTSPSLAAVAQLLISPVSSVCYATARWMSHSSLPNSATYVLHVCTRCWC